MSKPTATFLWLDLETTGLDPAEEAVLECAYVITDKDLIELAAGERVFYMHRRAFETDRYGNIPEIDPYVLKMHTENGLWEEAAASAHGYAAHGALEEFLLAAIGTVEWDGNEPADKADAKRLPILAGSTIKFDHSFLRVDAPRFANDEVIHYRQLDITATILLAKTVGVTFAKAEAHRAMADVRESLENARRCRRLLAVGANPFAALGHAAASCDALTELELDELARIFAKLRVA